jgi:hypothetical protein
MFGTVKIFDFTEFGSTFQKKAAYSLIVLGIGELEPGNS